MTITTYTQVSDLIDREVLDPTGHEIGTVSSVYVDDVTNEPAWLAITTGWFGTMVSFAPVAGAYLADDDVVVAYPKDTVRDAPNIDVDGSLTPDEASALYAYYGISTTTTRDRTTHVDSVPGREKRLRKWADTEDVHMAVPIRRETARLVSDQISDTNRDAPFSGPDVPEAEHEDGSTRERGGAVEDRQRSS